MATGTIIVVGIAVVIIVGLFVSGLSKGKSKAPAESVEHKEAAAPSPRKRDARGRFIKG